MSIVSTTGIGSGIDISTIVSQLVKAEGQPAFNAIQRQEDSVNARLSGLGTLKSALSDFQSAISALKDGSVFKTHQAVSSNESILKVTAGVGSLSGSHTVEVTQLANSQRSITSAEFANSADVVGTGTLTFSSGGGTPFSLTIDVTNNTLAGVRDAINGAAGNTSVTASIVNVDNAAHTGTISKLVLTSKNTGVANAFTVTGSDNDGNNTDSLGLSRLFSSNLSTQTTATDAVIKVDGQTATRSTNSMTDVLQGLTLDLQSAVVGTTVNVNVTLDNQAINKTISDFVTAYNKLHTVTKDLGKYGGASGAGSGALIGDSTLRYISSQLRQDASNPVASATSGFNSLAMIGVTIDKDGVMALDGTKLDAALSSNLQSVSNIFTSSDGVAIRLDAKLSQYLQSGGSLDSQQSSLQKRLTALEDRKNAVQLRLDNLQKSMQKQFIAMDTAVGQFQATGSYLTNALKKL